MALGDVIQWWSWSWWLVVELDDFNNSIILWFLPPFPQEPLWVCLCLSMCEWWALWGLVAGWSYSPRCKKRLAELNSPLKKVSPSPGSKSLAQKLLETGKWSWEKPNLNYSVKICPRKFLLIVTEKMVLGHWHFRDS